jgi:hypothetical protein
VFDLNVGGIKTPNLSKDRDKKSRVPYQRKAELPIDFVKVTIDGSAFFGAQNQIDVRMPAWIASMCEEEEK